MQQPSIQTAPPPSPGPAAVPAGPGPGTPLDRLETNRQFPEGTPQAINPTELNDPVAWIHSGWINDRNRVRAALVRAGSSRSRIDAWDGCGGGLWIVESAENPGTYEVRRAYCHDRLCRICGTARAHRIGNNLRDKIADHTYRLITLTLRSTTETLTNLLDKLYQAFYDLRRCRLWKNKIEGGVAFLEIKFNRGKERWHPHLHIICQGSFIRAGDLSREWHRVTKDSYITDVRLIHNADKAIAYVTKYASKPLASSFLRIPDRLDEAVTALHGRRLATTFGSWRGWKLTESRESGTWNYVVSMSEALIEAQLCSAFHIRLLMLLNVRPDFTLILPQPRPPPPPPPPRLPFAPPSNLDQTL